MRSCFAVKTSQPVVLRTYLARAEYTVTMTTADHAQTTYSFQGASVPCNALNNKTKEIASNSLFPHDLASAGMHSQMWQETVHRLSMQKRSSPITGLAEEDSSYHPCVFIFHYYILTKPVYVQCKLFLQDV